MVKLQLLFLTFAIITLSTASFPIRAVSTITSYCPFKNATNGAVVDNVSSHIDAHHPGLRGTRSDTPINVQKIKERVEQYEDRVDAYAPFIQDNSSVLRRRVKEIGVGNARVDLSNKMLGLSVRVWLIIAACVVVTLACLCNWCICCYCCRKRRSSEEDEDTDKEEDQDSSKSVEVSADAPSEKKNKNSKKKAAQTGPLPTVKEEEPDLNVGKNTWTSPFTDRDAACVY